MDGLHITSKTGQAGRWQGSIGSGEPLPMSRYGEYPSIDIRRGGYCYPINSMILHNGKIAPKQTMGVGEENAPIPSIGTNQHHAVGICYPEVSKTLIARLDGSPDIAKGRVAAICAIKSIVRRLTPLECERLMGFPDNYTKIPYRGKPAEKCPDTPRYKACGNSWMVNCARWILLRINEKENERTK